LTQTQESPTTKRKNAPSDATDEELLKFLDKLTPQEIEDIAVNLGELEKSREAFPLLHYEPHPKQLEFHRMESKERFAFGGNSSGKSFAGAAEAAFFLLGKDPTGLTGRTFPKPRRKFGGIEISTKLWLGCVKTDKGVEILKQNLLPLLPKGSHYPLKETKGLLEMKNGASLQVMSYDQDVEKWQSDAIDGIWLDEQPPRWHYDECRARVARRNGLIWCTVTPLGKNSPWMYWEIYRNVNNNPDVDHLFMDIEDNIYLTQEMKQRLYTAYAGTDEEAARLRGEFLLRQGVIHKGFDRSTHVIDDFEIKKSHKEEYEFARIFDLHPRNPNVCMWVMFKKTPPIAYVIRDFSMQGFIGDYADSVTKQTEDMEIFIKVNVIDTPDPKNPEQPGTTLRLEMAKRGIAGIVGNRDLNTGIQRFNEYIKNGSLFIFKSCKDTVFSVENFRWDNWRGPSAELKNAKEKPIAKDDHHCRGLHMFLLWMPAISLDSQHLDEKWKHGYNLPKYGLNVQRRGR